MRNILKKIATVTTVIALIIVTGICMTACGGNSDDASTGSVNNIDNLKGFYANIEAQKVYYFDGEKFEHGEFFVSEEPNENGVYSLRIKSLYDESNLYVSNKLQINRGTQACTVYKVWNNYGYETLLISTNQDANSQDLSKQFFARDDELIYSKISSLTEFFAEAFPGMQIDTSTVTNNNWKGLLLAA